MPLIDRTGFTEVEIFELGVEGKTGNVKDGRQVHICTQVLEHLEKWPITASLFSVLGLEQIVK